jgi:hypothetical protein
LITGLLGVLASACGVPDDDPTLYVGAFVYEEGEATAVCKGVPYSELIGGLEVEITRAGSGLNFLAGPRCSIDLEIAGDAAYGHAGQICRISVSQTVAAGVFSEFRVGIEEDALVQSASGTVALTVPTPAELVCEEFGLTGRLVRREP